VSLDSDFDQYHVLGKGCNIGFETYGSTGSNHIKPARLGDVTSHIGYIDRNEGETDEEYDNRCYRMYHYDKSQDNKREFQKKERKLKQQLGRKLTNGEKNHIRLVKVGLYFFYSQDDAEYQFHPELEDVWGDIADKIVPVKPVPMEAHPSLKLTLLPFQKESLHWMKKQEEGPWKGGMLADEMGMGKTQAISLSCLAI
jgi:SNF2 family DNA or RNA helicase